jgi:hypothetical protein
MISTEEINDIYITPSYWDNIFNEANQANILNGSRVVYMARIWCQRLNLYFYKIIIFFAIKLATSRCE